MASTDDKKTLLTTREAAQYLGLKTNTLEHWRSKKRMDLPSAKLGRAVRYDVRDIDEFVAKKKT